MAYCNKRNFPDFAKSTEAKVQNFVNYRKPYG